MANHKRRKRKNLRGGCLLCKPHKGNGAKGKFCNQTKQEKRSQVAFREQIDEHPSIAS